MKEKSRKRLERSQGEGREVRVRLTLAEWPEDLFGYVLGLSDELVLLYVFHDFHPDGCIVVRTKDIAKVRSNELERQSERLHAAEGLTKAVGISRMPPLDDMKTLLRHVQEARLPVILEADRFLVGHVTRVEGKRCWIHHFDALGRWDEKPTRVGIKRIATVQIESPYVTVWLRHLEPCPSLPEGDGQ